MTGVTIAWNSTNTAVATVDRNGMITAVAPGNATITGTIGARSASANIVVLSGAVASVSVTLSTSSTVMGQAVTATATVRDAGNVVLTGRTVTWASSNPTIATVSPTGAITPLATGSTTITATCEGVDGTATLTVASVTVSSVTVMLGNSHLRLGEATRATAIVRDANNDVLTGRSVTWSSSNPSVATVNSDGDVTAVTQGTATISAMVEGVVGTAGVTVDAPVAGILVAMAQNPISTGQGTIATATLRDDDGNTVSGGVVEWESSNTAVAMVSPTGVVTGVSIGVATISATIGSVTGSAPIEVQAAIGSVSVTLGSSNLRVGLTTLATAAVRDQAGNVLIGRAVGWSSTATATATVSSTGTVTGVAPGPVTILASVDGISAGAGLTVIPNTGGGGGGATTATQLAITQQPGGASSGVGFVTPAIVEIRDASNALVPTSTLVTATIASGSGMLAGALSTIAVNGVAAFSDLKVNGFGPHSLTFTATGLTSATSASFNVTQTPVALGIQSQPGGAVTGAALTTQPVVRLLDAAGLLVSSSTLSVTASIASGTGTLMGTTTVNAAGGVASFTNLRIDGLGNHTLRFSTSAPSLQATSVVFAVAGGVASQVVIVTQPGAGVSGSNLTTQPVVHVRDMSNNTVAGAANVVTASLASGTGTLVGTTTVAASNGIAQFTNLRINGSGAHTLRFTSSGLTPATSGSVNITQNVTTLSVQTQPAGAQTGTVFTTQPVIRLLDAAGVLVGGATHTVTASVSSGSGTLGGTAAVSAVNGVATFTNLSITGGGTHRLNFSTSSPSLNVLSSQFVVGSAGAATQLAITQQPGGAVSGVNLQLQPVVQIRDASNTIVTTSTATVIATITTGSGTLIGTAQVNAVNGVATFTGLRVNGVGSHVLTFSSTGLASAASTAFTVNQAAASLVLQTQPGSATSGAPLGQQPVVRILDNAGLLIATSNVAVTATRTTGTATLSGTNPVNAVNGVATFTDLRLDGSGSTVLRFSIASPAINVSSSVFTVMGPAGGGTPTQLIVSQQPGNAITGLLFGTQPVVRVADAGGSTVTGYTGPIAASIVTQPAGGGSLGGTTTVNAVAGIATFTNLSIAGTTGAYSLGFQSASPTLNATSATFSLGVPAAPGTVTGTVTGATTGRVQLLAGTTSIATVTVNGGSYVISGVAPGTYTARYHPPLNMTVVGADPTITVTSGAGVSQNFTASSSATLYSDDFQSYTNTSQLNSGSKVPGNFFSGANGGAADIGAVSTPSGIVFDPTGGIYGDKSMRYDWPAKPTAACSVETTVGVMPRLNPPPAGTKDLWVRFTSKESPNFEHGRTGCVRSYKFFLIQLESGTTNGRFGTYLFDGVGPNPGVAARLYMDMNDNQGAYNAVPSTLSIGGEPTWGGAYHTWVLEMRGIGTGTTTFRVYKDGALVGTLSGAFLNGLNPGPGWSIMFEMGANINNGPDHAQSRWWREFGVYTARPSLLLPP